MDRPEPGQPGILDKGGKVMGVTQVVQVQCDNCGRVEAGGPDGLNDIGPGWMFVDSRTGERIPDKEIDADGDGLESGVCLCPDCADKVKYDPGTEQFAWIAGTPVWSVETEWDGKVSLVISQRHADADGADKVIVYAMLPAGGAQRLADALRSALTAGTATTVANGAVSLR